jgi:microcystin-dependent protein
MSNSAISGLTIIDFPAGMIMPYAGTSTPAGWLECNGAEIDISAYPTLSAALGTTWNNAKNPLTGATYANPAAGKFRLPDLRGSFLRGSSGGVSNAQGVATGLAEFQQQKTKVNGLSGTAAAQTGTAAGQTQGTSNISLASGVAASDGVSHNHGYQRFLNVSSNWDGWIVNDGDPNRVHAVDMTHDTTTGGESAKNHTHGVSGTTNIAHTHSATSVTLNTSSVTLASTDAETRPDAVGVRYLIKI